MISVEQMADALFEERRLAGIYDELDPDRSDLDPYFDIVTELGATRVLDIGCGTGTFCCLLAERGIEVTGVDPALASLEVAGAKPGADKVRWLLGDASSLPRLQVDLVTMTANVAQVFITDDEWAATLTAIRSALRAGGYLVFETRDPRRRAWQDWTRSESYRRTDIPTVGVVQSWVEVLRSAEPLVSFRWTFHFEEDQVTMTSDSTLRFRDHVDIVTSLDTAGFDVVDVRDAPDRPGRELVFIARSRHEV